MASSRVLGRDSDDDPECGRASGQAVRQSDTLPQSGSSSDSLLTKGSCSPKHRLSAESALAEREARNLLPMGNRLSAKAQSDEQHALRDLCSMEQSMAHRSSAESALEEQADYTPMTNAMDDVDSQASKSEQEADQAALITMVRERPTANEETGETTSEEEQHDRSHDERLHRRVSRRTGPLHAQGNELVLFQAESLAGSSITASDSEKSEAVKIRVPSSSSANSLLDQSRTKAAHMSAAAAAQDHDLEVDRDLGESSEDEEKAQGCHEHQDARTPNRLALSDEIENDIQSRHGLHLPCTEESTIEYENTPQAPNQGPLQSKLKVKLWTRSLKRPGQPWPTKPISPSPTPLTARQLKILAFTMMKIW